MTEIKLKRRNPIVAAWLSYWGLRRLGILPRGQCLRLALSHFRAQREEP